MPVIVKMSNCIKEKLIKLTAYKNDMNKPIIPTKGIWVFCVDNIVFLTLAIGVILAAYIICVYELDLFWRLDTSYAEKTLEGIKTILINVSFSYLAGWIIYLFTVVLPKWEENRRMQPLINEQITTIYNHIHRIVCRFYLSDNPNLRDVEACIGKMKESNWGNKNSYPDHLEGKSLLEVFLYDYGSLVAFIEQSTQEYGRYYSKKQIRLLENIKRNNINYMYSLLAMPRAGINRRNIDLHILPSFTNILKWNVELQKSIHGYSVYRKEFKEYVRKHVHHSLTGHYY